MNFVVYFICDVLCFGATSLKRVNLRCDFSVYYTCDTYVYAAFELTTITV